VGNRRADHATPLSPQKLALQFVDQRRFSLVDQKAQSLYAATQTYPSFTLQLLNAKHCSDNSFRVRHSNLGVQCDINKYLLLFIFQF
jgi:hypothetical protein